MKNRKNYDEEMRLRYWIDIINEARKVHLLSKGRKINIVKKRKDTK